MLVYLALRYTTGMTLLKITIRKNIKYVTTTNCKHQFSITINKSKMIFALYIMVVVQRNSADKYLLFRRFLRTNFIPLINNQSYFLVYLFVPYHLVSN